MTGEPLVQVCELAKSFVARRGAVIGAVTRRLAVDSVSFDIHQSETLGIVGESGSGKSTLARLMAGLLRPDAGTVRLGAIDPGRRRGRMRRRAAQTVQMVFQDPLFLPQSRLRICSSVIEPLVSATGLSKAAARARTREMLVQVGIPESVIDRYPHEFSGGQRQRICIARALVIKPQLVILDEAVSALDVSIKSQILNLLNDLRDHVGATFVFISHDLAITRQFCSRIAVMLQGRIVEMGPSDQILKAPLHPYTQLLVCSIPRRDGGLPLEPSHAGAFSVEHAGKPVGCRFVDRCPIAFGPCRTVRPRLLSVSPDRSVACHAATASAEGQF
jgi:peptide/nickel transport system ATP-binding protein